MGRRLILWWITLSVILWSTAARAVLTIEITRGEESGIPIAVVPFGWQGSGQPPQSVSDIIQADLARSGRFAVVPSKDFLSQPHHDKEVVFKDWQLLKAEALVIGDVQLVAPNRYQVAFRLYDVFKQQQLAGFRYTVGANLLRSVAHQISDVVFEKLTGVPGAFNTRIAYVIKEHTPRGLLYKLQVADSDGYGPKTILASREPLLSPTWSPDGTRLAYVAFEHRLTRVYVQDVASGERELVAGFRGVNSAPAWSPHGNRLALALSRGGNMEIYVMRLATHALRRLTDDPAINTEPAWSPDGRTIVFTSDRSGRPQIYRMSSEGGPAERLTYDGDYNARASFSPDGKLLTLVHMVQGMLHVSILHLDDGSLQVLTDTPLDDSPSFAPNGQMIIYSTQLHGQGVIATVSVDGRVRQVYRTQEGSVRDPAWSPYNRELQYSRSNP